VVGELFIGNVNSRDDVAEELMEDFGDRFGPDTRVEAAVRFILRPGGITVGTFTMPIVKQCGETLAEAYEAQVSSASSGGGGPIGDIAGPGNGAGLGEQCIYIPGRTATVEVVGPDGRVVSSSSTFVPGTEFCMGV
jgi:hypothetical protein